MSACPKPQEWVGLVDGELTENRAAELRGHAAGCSTCARALADVRTLVARIAAPAPSLEGSGGLERLMSGLDAAEPLEDPRPRLHARRALGALAFSIAAVGVFALLLPRGATDRGVFTPRGVDPGWARKVGVEIWALERPLRRLTPGAVLAPGTPVVATYRNVDAAPAYLLAFALDRDGEAHWLYPAHLDPRRDPAAVRLDPSAAPRAFSDSAILEGIEGSLRFVFVVTREPLRVSSIEGLPAALRDPDRLRARWPDARVDELTARIEASPARVP